MNVWEQKLLGEHVDLLTGFPFKSSLFTDDTDGLRLLRGDNVIQGQFRWDGVKYWPLTKSENLTKYFLQPHDVIVAMDRPWIEAGLKFACVTTRDIPCLLVQRVSRLRGMNGLDTDFLRYIIADQTFTDYVKRIATGATVPHISPSQIRDFRFCLPPLPIQRKIAAVLSAYDGLIENNTRRIQILEDMAQMLYREWFVHFRFPGHEQSNMVETAHGPMPEEWTLKTIKDVSTFIGRGISPSYNEAAKGIVINQKCIRDGRLSLAQARRQEKSFSAERLVRFADVLINSTGIGTLGRVAQVYENISSCTVDSHVTIARPGPAVGLDYYGFQLLEMQAHFDKLGVGSTGQTELARERVAASLFLLPPLQLQERFGALVRDMRKAAVLNEKQNHNLRQTRDLLLPKLISGEVDVSELEIATGEMGAGDAA